MPVGLGNWLIQRISNYLMQERPLARSYLCDFDRISYEVRMADVLLIEGHSHNSRIIKRITQSPWSHAALFIGRLHDIEDVALREKIHHTYQGSPTDQLIIEAILGKGTVIRSLTAYRDKHIRICRPSGLAQKDAQKVVAHAVGSIGKPYNIRHLIDLGRFLIGSRFIPRRWKSSLFEYQPGQATQDICSSMIASAFISIKFPILPLIREDQQQQLEMIMRNPRLFTPSDFDYSPYFNIIKYPLLPVAGAAAYRNLPWQEGLVYNDEVGIHHHSKQIKKDTIQKDEKNEKDS